MCNIMTVNNPKLSEMNFSKCNAFDVWISAALQLLEPNQRFSIVKMNNESKTNMADFGCMSCYHIYDNCQRPLAQINLKVLIF